MKPKEIFDLAARIAGLVVFVYGMGHVLYGLCGAMDLIETKYTKYNAFTGVVEVIVGLMIMRAVIPLSDIAFPPREPQAEEETEILKAKEKHEGKVPYRNAPVDGGIALRFQSNALGPPPLSSVVRCDLRIFAPSRLCAFAFQPGSSDKRKHALGLLSSWYRTSTKRVWHPEATARGCASALGYGQPSLQRSNLRTP